MARRILILGLKPGLVEEFRAELRRPGFEVVSGSDLTDLRAAFADGDIDHVFLGGGLDISTRAEAVEIIFGLSDLATVHMKDQLSGPQGFVPFVKAVLNGIAEYEPQPSTDAVLRAPRHDAARSIEASSRKEPDPGSTA